MTQPDKLYGKVIAIEVYDDLIRYDGKPIWMGAPYRKTEEEVNTIVKNYLLAQSYKDSGHDCQIEQKPVEYGKITLTGGTCQSFPSRGGCGSSTQNSLPIHPASQAVLCETCGAPEGLHYRDCQNQSTKP